MSRTHARRRAGCYAGILLGITLIAGCGGGSNLPQATRSPTASRSVSAPSVSRTASLPAASSTAPVPSESAPSPSATRTASAEETQDATPTASSTPSQPAPPTVTATSTRTVTTTPSATDSRTQEASETPTPSATETPTPGPSVTPTPSTTPAAAESDSADSLWWVWLLVAALVAAGIGWLLLARARRRKWDAEFALALAKARSVVDTLVPSLLDRSVTGAVLAERWRGSQAQLDEVETELARLGSSTAGTDRGERVAGVSAAAAALRQALTSDVTLRSGARATLESDLARSSDLVQARGDALLAAIENRPGAAPSPSAAGTVPPA